MKKAFYNEPSEGSFTFEDVKFSRNGESGLYKVEWMEELSKPMNSEEIYNFNNKNYSAGNPIVPSMKTLGQFFGSLNIKTNAEFYNHLSNQLEENPWINVSTNPIYFPVGEKDKIIHYEGLRGINGQEDLEEVFEGEYIGQNGALKVLRDGQIFEDFTGQRKNKLEKISQKINRTPGYLWGFNSKPEKKIKTQARLDAYSDRLFFYADRSLYSRNPCFRVLIKKQD